MTKNRKAPCKTYRVLPSKRASTKAQQGICTKMVVKAKASCRDYGKLVTSNVDTCNQN